jgi:hypothetical protein
MRFPTLERSPVVKLEDFIQHLPCHECAPKEWRHTHNITGNHEMDASIEHSKNGDMRQKLSDFVSYDEAYGPITGYSGYHGYRGDN